MLLHIGLDDTDSPIGGCTTYIAASLVEKIQELGGKFIDYPNLLRLNPNVPWKTRGNGAICLRIEIEPKLEGPVRYTVIKAVEAYSEFECENTNPGVVFHSGKIPEPLTRFSDCVISGVVSLEDALKLVDKHSASAIGYKNMRGIIGALAAIGGLQSGDHTFELLSYRKPENWGKPRLLDTASVRVMDERTRKLTFNNVDPETGRILIAPHGPDPVLYGIRGETAEAVYRAAMMVEAVEDIERWVIFRSNQGTDAHLRHQSNISELKPFHPAIVTGVVVEGSRTIKGGHVIFRRGDDTGRIDCAAYEPTGSFREVVRQLVPGDRIRAYGGVRGLIKGEGGTLNLEKLEVLHLASDLKLVNPSCPTCGGSMESMGRGKGFRCRRCSLRDRELTKQTVEVKRQLEPGLFIPPPKAQRHLTKPLVRYGREKKIIFSGELFESWHWP